MKITSHFRELTYWNLDNRTSGNDRLQKVMLWTRIAKTVSLLCPCFTYYITRIALYLSPT